MSDDSRGFVPPNSTEQNQPKLPLIPPEAIANALSVLGAFLDESTLADIVRIVATADEAEAMSSCELMQSRLLSRMRDAGIGDADAARHATHIAGQVREAWTALHRAQGQA